MKNTTSPVRYEVRDRVAWLTIDRPERKNALDTATLAGLHAGFARAASDADVRALVLTGSGADAFCAGADLKSDLRPDYSQPRGAYASLLTALDASPLPLVARINGHCLAGGMGLLAVCDLAVAAEHALFGLPEVKVGLFPMQVVALLQRLVTARVLADLCLTGEPLGAHAARDAGLVNYVAPPGELDARTDALLERLVKNSPTAQRRGKHAMRIARGMSSEQALAYLESQLATLLLTEDAREGRSAFVERRTPEWSGR